MPPMVPDDSNTQSLKRRRIEADNGSGDQNDQNDTLRAADQPTANGSIYPAINISGNAWAILGNVNAIDSHFFRHGSNMHSSEMLLNALYFEGMRSRKEQIDARAGSPNYVEWIWDTNFPTWLEGPGSFYWITGRAGSGKSTLMKHICDSRKTLEILQRDGQKWTKLHFFFDFRAGNDIANSIEGMLRSLLYQLVKQLPEVAQQIDHAIYTRNVRNNSLSCCMNSFCEVLNTTSTRICAFVDGLDEFEGSVAELLEIIHGLKDRTAMKICLASRPHPIFESDLSKFPHLAVQDYNHDSIRLYTESRWKSSRVSIQASLPRVLSYKIREKARGVFLWARLATDELLRDFLAGKPIAALEQQLEQMPKEVEEMYQRILNRLPLILKAEAAILLYMIISAQKQVAVRKLYAALEAVLKSMGTQVSLLPIEIDADNDYRISAVLGDFLDVNSTTQLDNDQGSSKPAPQITFENSRLRCRRDRLTCVSLTHETLRSFLIKTKWLSENLPSNLSIAHRSRFWFNIYVDEIATCAQECHDQSSQIYSQVKAYVRKAEKYLDNSDNIRRSMDQKELMDLLNLWLRWTPLLPFALQEIFDEIQQPDVSQDGFSDLQQIMVSPFFALHSAICIFQTLHRCFPNGISAEDIMLVDGERCCTYIVSGGESNLDSAVEMIGQDITVALCHELPHYIYYQVTRGVLKSAKKKQYLFDLLWRMYQDTLMHKEFEPLLQFLVTVGCRLEGRHLCALFMDEYHHLPIPDFFFTFISCHLVKNELKHSRRCVRNCKHLGQSSYLYHWAEFGMTGVPKRAAAAVFACLMKTLLTCGQQIHHICWIECDTLLNFILACVPTPEYERRYRMTKFIIALKSGANPHLTGQSGTAFEAGRKLMETLKASPEDESYEGRMRSKMIVEAQKINEVLEYYANHQKLPSNLDDYLQFDSTEQDILFGLTDSSTRVELNEVNGALVSWY